MAKSCEGKRALFGVMPAITEPLFYHIQNQARGEISYCERVWRESSASLGLAVNFDLCIICISIVYGENIYKLLYKPINLLSFRLYAQMKKQAKTPVLDRLKQKSS